MANITLPDSFEVLPGELVWAPGLTTLPHGVAGLLVNALELGTSDGTVAQYCVQHYSAKAHGRAFGPLGLDQTLRFCRQLTSRLVSQSCTQQIVFLTTPPGNLKARANASVFLGAFLILCRQYTANQVADVLGREEADRKFPCSWSRTDDSAAKMPVMCCWQGLEMAQQHGWIDTSCFHDDVRCDLICSMTRQMVTTYDASWIVPGRILVSADPVTTQMDPNPATFRDLWPSKDSFVDDGPAQFVSEEPATPQVVGTQFEYDCRDICDEEKSDSTFQQPYLSHQRQVTQTTELCETSTDATPPPGFMSRRANCLVDVDGASEAGTEKDEVCSLDTVCKDYTADVNNQGLLQSVNIDALHKPNTSKSFVQFLKDCRVNSVIRANFGDEEGMPGGKTYSAKKLQEYGIEHRDIQFVDKDGGLPPGSSIVEMLKMSCNTDSSQDSALLIHCKGGFGRSIVLACCWAIYTYDIPGPALLGWVRIARPGSLTTPIQEDFLLSLSGRADIIRLAQEPKTKSPSNKARALAAYAYTNIMRRRSKVGSSKDANKTTSSPKQESATRRSHLLSI